MAKRGYLTPYRSYVFRDKDPVIDALRTVITDQKIKRVRIHELSGVSVTTLHNWFDGETRRPQFATVAAVSRALGKNGILFTAGGKPFFANGYARKDKA